MQHAFLIPAYGESPYLAQCLASLRRQTHADSLIVITTSTPTPFLETAARNHGVALKVNPVRENIATDWNFALAATTADLVTLAHQDDFYEPGYAQSIRDAFDRHPGAVLAFTGFGFCSADGRVAARLNRAVKMHLAQRAFRRTDYLDDARSKRRLLQFGNPVCCPSVALNLRAIPRFRFAPDMSSNLDWQAWASLAEQAGGFAYVHRNLVFQRVHDRTTTNSAIERGQRQAEDRRMFERFWSRPVAAMISTIYALSYRAHRAG